MGAVTLSMQNRLFWLGRYTERVYTTIQFLLEQYDKSLDSEGMTPAEFCRRMGIPCREAYRQDFFRHYLFDAENPDSVHTSVEQMLGNGMVLRETITSPTLAYLQMAHNAMELAAESDGPSVQLQWVLDDIMAFRGSLDDCVEGENTRNTTKCGSLVERLSLMLRLNWRSGRLQPELRKRLNRLYKTDLPIDRAALDTVTGSAMGGTPAEPGLLLRSVEGLFLV